ncbi:MAG: tyrosine-type recombinase/integrase, partial [Trebonia sp.]
ASTRERVYLTIDQVDELADATGPSRVVILFLAYTGVRFGELAALRVRRLDFLRRRAAIAEAVAEVRGKSVFGTPKGHQERSVPIPVFLVEELAELVAGKEVDDLVFTAPKGGILRLQNFRHSVWEPAARSVGLGELTPHSLRHTAASLAIASGADVKVVQQMLGHKSATMTLDLYGHLYDDRLDEVAERMDAARRRARITTPRSPEGVVTPLHGSRRG